MSQCRTPHRVRGVLCWSASIVPPANVQFQGSDSPGGIVARFRFVISEPEGAARTVRLGEWGGAPVEAPLTGPNVQMVTRQAPMPVTSLLALKVRQAHPARA